MSKRLRIATWIGLILAVPAVWLAELIGQDSQRSVIYRFHFSHDEEGEEWAVIPLPLDSSQFRPHSLYLVRDVAGWPASSNVLLTGSLLRPDEVWVWAAGSIARWPSNDTREARRLIEEECAASGNHDVVAVLRGDLPPTGRSWLGTIVNLLFWWIVTAVAALATLTLARGTDRAAHIPKELIERDRMLEGLCPKCAYDLRGTVHESLCPECGVELPGRALREAQKRAVAKPSPPTAPDQPE